jgi:polyphosphate kinase
MAEPDREPLQFPSPAGAQDAALLLNRELSWIEFNRRVLTAAADPDRPLLERVKFVAIFGSNLDEFFMKRIGGLKQLVASNVVELSPDGRSPQEQLRAVNAAVRPLVAEQHRLFSEELMPALARHGLQLVCWEDLDAGERREMSAFFHSSVFPILTPLALDPAHPFPFISNLSLSLAVAVRHPDTGQERFARVKVPRSLPRFTQLPGSMRFVPLEDVIAHHLEHLFPGMEVAESHAFRATRNADGERNEEPADDLLESIQEELRERRFATVVRLQVVPKMPQWMRSLLCEELEVGAEDVFENPPPLALADAMQLANLPLWPLRDTPWRSVTQRRLQGADLFETIRQGDILVHHPYESFTTSVQRFLETAATDPAVVAIKQTLYRTSKNSPIVRALIAAAERGKQVAVLVELKARFDEERNIEMARALEEAGAHVAYGVVGFKTHAKATLVVRQESDALRSYAHLSTGNYNAETANIYTDFGLFTCRPDITGDLAQLFNALTGVVRRPTFRKLLVAPFSMRQSFADKIQREIEHAKAGRPARVVAKMNALEDSSMVRALYEASRAGVDIDLLVRGISRIRPGLPGWSERVRVVSIVGRFLEHARIFRFENGGSPEVYLSSADWMSRNLDWRMEIAVPVEDPALQEELRMVLDLQLSDNVDAWDQQPDGSWQRRGPAPGEAPRQSQLVLTERARRGVSPGKASPRGERKRSQPRRRGRTS